MLPSPRHSGTTQLCCSRLPGAALTKCRELGADTTQSLSRASGAQLCQIKSGGQDRTPSEASWGGACLASSCSCCSPWCSLTPGHITAVSAPVVAWLSSLCLIFSAPNDPSHWTQPTPTQQVGPPHLIPPAQTLFHSTHLWVFLVDAIHPTMPSITNTVLETVCLGPTSTAGGTDSPGTRPRPSTF